MGVIQKKFEKENKEIRVRIAELNEKVEKLKCELEEKNKTFEDKTGELEKQKKDYADLKEENKKFKEKIRELESKNDGLEKQLKQKKTVVSGNFVEISIDGIEELYPDETKDYILSVLKKEEKQNLPKESKEYERTKHILDIIIEKNNISDGLEQLKYKIKQSEKEKDYLQSLKSVFTKHVGIEIDNSKRGHNKITINNSGRDFVLTVSSTPSDEKGNKNNVQDLMKKILLRSN
jgi:chromosome segregation ATPase